MLLNPRGGSLTPTAEKFNKTNIFKKLEKIVKYSINLCFAWIAQTLSS